MWFLVTNLYHLYILSSSGHLLRPTFDNGNGTGLDGISVGGWTWRQRVSGDVTKVTAWHISPMGGFEMI